MQTIYHYRCETCKGVHEDSSSIFKCEICGAEICEDCVNNNETCFDYYEKIVLSPRETIQKFIDDNQYTYSVEDILEEYKNKYGKWYTSYTMTICCKTLENEIKALI